jgi:glycosyltransferase involved in cell wall biosynthesis
MESGVNVHVVGAEAFGSDSPLIFHGVVPDLRPWLENADACLLPYTSEYPLAGGARNKLLEYLAVGRRVVSTREGLRGLEEAAEWQGVEIAPDDPPGFAAAIAAGLRRKAESALGDEQHRADLTWDKRGRELSRVLRQLVEAPGG